MYMDIQNSWERYWRVLEAQQSVCIDIDRVFREIRFFQRDRVKNEIRDVICYWCLYKNEKYQQGMMYVLSIVVYVTWENRENSEADAFLMFDRLMTLEFSKYFQSDSQYLHKKCEKIIQLYLKLVDVELYIILERNSINCEFFLLYFYSQEMVPLHVR